MAEGYAAVGRHAQAYAEMLRAEAFVKASRAGARDGQVLRLQARYDASRRDAENAELRHRSESALLQLQTQAARQRSLWTALLALAALLAMVAYFGARALARRRTLADLALRDELTGQPNRRAVAAYAQAQFEQTRRLGDSLGLPLALAMIDLDHFKSVNDRWGHAVGDAALRAFASAASSVLRGQDRLGRWGGEEWLLVMPGTSAAELPLVFERLRSRYAATPIEGIEGRHGLTFSMGGAELQAATPNLEALIAEADRELFRAKREGRNALRHAA
jgi:diguanylate cyclase (GGDEF)-like protein